MRPHWRGPVSASKEGLKNCHSALRSTPSGSLRPLAPQRRSLGALHAPGTEASRAALGRQQAARVEPAEQAGRSFRRPVGHGPPGYFVGSSAGLVKSGNNAPLLQRREEGKGQQDIDEKQPQKRGSHVVSSLCRRSLLSEGRSPSALRGGVARQTAAPTRPGGLLWPARLRLNPGAAVAATTTAAAAAAPQKLQRSSAALTKPSPPGRRLLRSSNPAATATSPLLGGPSPKRGGSQSLLPQAQAQQDGPRPHTAESSVERASGSGRSGAAEKAPARQPPSRQPPAKQPPAKQPPGAPGRAAAGTSLEVRALLPAAARLGDVETARWCLAEGAGPNDLDTHGWAPLHYSASGGHVAVCKLLVDFGCDVDALLPDMSSPLMLAAEEAHLPVAVLLLQRGARPAAKDEDGFTALDRCDFLLRKAFEQLLRDSQSE